MAHIRFAAFAALPLLLPGAAFAAAATAAQDVNVRSGPATSYGIVGKLQAGQSVDVRQCEGSFCQVTFGTATGWVSANYLTRGMAAKPTAPQVAAAPPAMRSSDLPPLTQSTAAAAPPAYSAPRVAAVPPHEAMALPRGAFPPAYEGGGSSDEDYADDADQGDDAGFDAPPRSAVHLPDDSGDVIASTDAGAPRPHADIPDVAPIGPDDGYADFGPDADSAYPVPGNAGGWRSYGRFHGPRYAGGPGGRVCFFTDDEFGQDGFCLRAGQSISDLGDWSHRIVAMRNPRGLPITVCSPAAYAECHVYRDSGPLLSARGIASITVAEPGF